MSGPPPLVTATHFGYRYRRDDAWAVHDLDLYLEQHAWLLLAGASGSGKSTFARALNGTVPHFYGGQIAGALTVCGLDPAEVPMSTTFRHVGVLFQDPTAQLFGTTVERELTFALESLGLPVQEIRKRVEVVVETLGIAALLQRAPHTLSGGEQQLILLAAFLALAPQLLVLDEPMTMLDAHAASRVLDVMQTIHQRGTGLIVIDHRLDAYVDVATSFALMKQGTITDQGALTSVLSRLFHDPDAGVAPPAATRWWKERILPALECYHDTPFPLSQELARQRIEHLPAEALHNLAIRESQDILPPIALPHLCAQLSLVAPLPAVAQSTPLIEWRHISYTYPPQRGEVWLGKSGATSGGEKSALCDVSSILQAGEIVALLGPNGAGKSTLLRTLNGLVRPQRGEVCICGQPVGHRHVAELARLVGYTPQRPERLFFCSTVADELAAGPRALGVEEATRTWQATLIEALELAPLLERSPYTLSAGQQRRVGLAAALAAQPRVVALDEPTAGLDASARATLAALLHELRAQGAAIVIVTHDTEFAATIASRWLLLVAGQLLADNTPAQILANESLLTEAAVEPSPFHQLDLWLSQWLSQIRRTGSQA